MEYTKKHKNLIANLFKKAGMLKEADFVLSCNEYKIDISNAMREAAKKANILIGSTPALLDAARRYENRDCAIFKECTLTQCEGGVWCNIYNLGGSHGRIGDAYRHLGKSAFEISIEQRRALMLGILAYKTRQTHKKDIKRIKKM